MAVRRAQGLISIHRTVFKGAGRLVLCICDPSTAEAKAGRGGGFTSQPSQIGELQASKSPCLRDLPRIMCSSRTEPAKQELL